MSTPYTGPEHCPEGLPRLVHAARRDGGSAQGAEHREALRVARKEIVTAFSHHIEEQARHAVDHPMVLSAVQRIDNFSESSRYLYQELAKMSPLVVVFGSDMPTDIGGGVRGVALGVDDPLREEWAVVTLGADTCRALVARQVADAVDRPGERRFEFLVTTDRTMVTKAARDLLARVP
jgi:DICT domain-containing protein